MTVDPETMRATGIDRLTTGPGPDAGVAVSTDGRRLAFTAKSQRIRTWLFPFDATAGHITGSGEAITSPGRMSVDPTLSPDGTKVAYVVPHGEGSGPAPGDVRNEVWVKSLVDGSEVPVISDDYSRWFPRWSPDGKQLAYERRNRRTNERQLMLWSSQSHEEKPLGSNLGALGLVSRRQVAVGGHRRRRNLVGPGRCSTACGNCGAKDYFARSGVRTLPDTLSLLTADGLCLRRWRTHRRRRSRRSIVIPAAGGAWRRITDGKHWDDKPRWSPDGRTIYFVSRRGGFFNVWGIHFDPTAGKTVGQPFQLSKFESPRLMIPRWIPPVGLSLTQDKLVLTMAEESGSIWVLDNVDR